MLKTLLDIETDGWSALSSCAERAKEFYKHLLADDAVMLFSNGLVLDGKEQILASFDTKPWQSFDIQEPRVVSMADDAALLLYKVTAQREGATQYIALVSSAYARSGDAWILCLHQHTPV